MKNKNSPEQLIGDSPETRLRQAVNVAYTVLSEHQGRDRTGMLDTGDNKFNAFIGTTSTGDKYLSYTLQDSNLGTAHRLNVELPSTGENLIINVENSFEVSGGSFLPDQGVVNGTDVLKLLDPLDLGARHDLRNKESGLSDPEFPTTFFRALPALNRLEDGDAIDIGSLRKDKFTVSRIDVGDDDTLLRFVDSAGFPRMTIELSNENGALSEVTFTETDELPINNGFVDYRGGTAIDSLAAKIVSKLAASEKKVEEEKPRTSLKDRLKRVFTSATAGYSDFGGSGSGWRNEQMNGETPQARDFRESVEYLESVLRRPEVITGLETDDSVEIASVQGELVVVKTDKPSEFYESLPEDGELVAVSAGTDEEVCVVGRFTANDGEAVIIIGRTIVDKRDDNEALSETLVLTKEPSGQVSTAYSSNEQSPSATAYGKGKITSRVRGFLKRFF